MSASPSERSPRCPGCGNRRLTPVVSNSSANLLCHACGACWHPERARLISVDPLSCPGCAFRRVCLAALGERSP